MERRPAALGCVAVPAAIRELLAQELMGASFGSLKYAPMVRILPLMQGSVSP
jgi:hypothetical protein